VLQQFPKTLAYLAEAEKMCSHCDLGLAPTKLKRQWVHHSPATGRIIVCTAHDLKPSGS
jgi:hypothetical protein